jgi:hypothetical protein
MWTVLKRLSMEILQQVGGLSRLSPLRSEDFRDRQKGDWTSWEAAKGIQNYVSSRRLSGSSPCRSDGSRDGQAGGLTSWEVTKEAQGRVGEQLENNSRKPRDLFCSWWYSYLSLSLSPVTVTCQFCLWLSLVTVTCHCPLSLLPVPVTRQL